LLGQKRMGRGASLRSIKDNICRLNGCLQINLTEAKMLSVLPGIK
jgi:hypothetical protein